MVEICFSDTIEEEKCSDSWTSIDKFIGGVRDGTVEIAFDNEPVLVTGVPFRKAARSKAGLTTIVSPNKSDDKDRTSMKGLCRQ